MLSEEETIEKYNSLIDNAKANWIYEDYEILLNFLDLYQKEKEKNYELSDKLTLKICQGVEEEVLEEFRNQNAELRDELEVKNAEITKEKEKNMKMISENIYLKEELQKTNRYSFEIDKLKEELNKEKEKNEGLVKDNLDLDRLYRRTAEHLHNKGKDELADYMLAQIGAVPTWTDFESYSNWVSKDKINAKIEELESKYTEDVKDANDYDTNQFVVDCVAILAELLSKEEE